MGRTALVLGATGLVGGELVNRLERKENYSQITLIGRRPFSIGSKKVRNVVVNMHSLKDVAEEFKVDDIFCCLGTTIKKAGSKEAFRQVDFQLPVAAAQLGSFEGAKNFLVISSMGANTNSAFFYNRVKGEMEEEVKKMTFDAIHIFRPSLLLGSRKEFRLGEKLAEWAVKPFSKILPDSLKKSFPIPAETVANAMAIAAQMEAQGINIYESGQIRETGKSIFK
ncbi:oxidoreductase [Neobacillus notoginsengisoli]|uniref:Oxidoreductase n=1 Tax=Neobacillus notoginsengisoli TaxID=1578198 RepID=A0A417YFA5_9BACI|nr:oxidoreductase [Neobacillus notoginsengisoli]RHW31411.1 oxidoreductase [Neobacillus notoginsengisoli]